MLHGMIDLETLSKRPDACILQIAAVVFEPCRGGQVSGEALSFNCYVSDEQQEDRHIDLDTVLWWTAQCENARRRMINGWHDGAVSLTEALIALGDWYAAQDITRVWSHGATFDIPILNHAFQQLRIDEPWLYNEARDTRTLFELNGQPDRRAAAAKAAELLGASNFVAHCALHDAVAQALMVQEALG